MSTWFPGTCFRMARDAAENQALVSGETSRPLGWMRFLPSSVLTSCHVVQHVVESKFPTKECVAICKVLSDGVYH